MITFSIAIPCRPDALDEALLRIRESTAFGQLGDTDRQHAQLLIEELVINAIRHGQPPDDAPVQVRLSVDRHELSIEIRDRGRAFDPTAHPRPDTTQALEDRPIGGLGIYLAQMLSDEILYRREQDENLTVLRKRLVNA